MRNVEGKSTRCLSKVDVLCLVMIVFSYLLTVKLTWPSADNPASNIKVKPRKTLEHQSFTARDFTAYYFFKIQTLSGFVFNLCCCCSYVQQAQKCLSLGLIVCVVSEAAVLLLITHCCSTFVLQPTFIKYLGHSHTSTSCLPPRDDTHTLK